MEREGCADRSLRTSAHAAMARSAAQERGSSKFFERLRLYSSSISFSGEFSYSDADREVSVAGANALALPVRR